MNLKKNKKAVLWVWAVCLMGIVIYSIYWYALGLATYLFWDAIESAYSFPSPTNITMTFIKLVFAWHPFLMILGLLLWAYVNSQRREDVTYPRY